MLKCSRELEVLPYCSNEFPQVKKWSPRKEGKCMVVSSVMHLANGTIVIPPGLQ